MNQEKQSNLLIKAAGFMTLMMGIGHTLAHFLMPILKKPDPAVVEMMVNTKINILIERSLLDFHSGFSMAMGFLVLGLGFQILFSKDNKKLQRVNMIMTGIMAIISIAYFHPVAMFFMGASCICLTINLYNTPKNSTSINTSS